MCLRVTKRFLVFKSYWMTLDIASGLSTIDERSFTSISNGFVYGLWGIILKKFEKLVDRSRRLSQNMVVNFEFNPH